MKERNISIDILKCLAALLITNSHFGLLYGDYNFLATGGCIGDVLFFFCSGFTLFLKPMGGVKQLPNWYKRRINRIYPSVVAVAIFACLFFDQYWDIIDIIIARPYWFVSCIMIYYLVIYFVGAYFKNKIFLISLFVALGTAVWFYFVYKTPGFSIYGGHYIRWLLFFVFMLFGAKLGTIAQDIKSKPINDVCMLILCLVVFYALFIVSTKIQRLAVIQYFTFLPLLATMFYFYKVGASHWMEKLYKSKVGNYFIRFVSGLCLEIYMVQPFLITDKMNSIFPLNIVIMFIIIFIAAYITRCLARFIAQTFKDSPYEWKQIVSWY